MSRPSNASKWSCPRITTVSRPISRSPRCYSTRRARSVASPPFAAAARRTSSPAPSHWGACLKGREKAVSKRLSANIGVVGPEDMRLSQALRMPLFGPEPRLARAFGSKSGARRIFQAARVNVPPGRHDVYDEPSLLARLAALIAAHPARVGRWDRKLFRRVIRPTRCHVGRAPLAGKAGRRVGRARDCPRRRSARAIARQSARRPPPA